VGLAVTDDHVELAATVRRWAEARGLLAEARVALEAPTRAAAGEAHDAEDVHDAEALPPWWGEVAEMGWLGLAVGVEHGGQGHGLAEMAVVIEELGRWCAPGPLLPTAIAAVAIDRWAGDPELARPLVDGARVGGLAVAGDLVVDDAWRVSGRARGVWGGPLADRFVLPVGRPDDRAWCVVDRTDAEVKALAAVDSTRGLAEVSLDGVEVEPGRWLSNTGERPADRECVVRLAELLAGAEALGVADWCVRTAADYAAVRVQFGRPIGQFQAVKHRCADMLVTLESARAAVWDAARCFDAPADEGAVVAQAAAAALAPEAGLRAAQDCIQILGGIGYTWEHDAHLFLKRASAIRHLLPAPEVARRRMAEAAAAGERRSLTVELPAEAEPLRAEVRAFVDDLRAQ
jgi:3-oxochol-4-en-24-oyl-CoA dehydrogenase